MAIMNPCNKSPNSKHLFNWTDKDLNTFKCKYCGQIAPFIEVADNLNIFKCKYCGQIAPFIEVADSPFRHEISYRCDN